MERDFNKNTLGSSVARLFASAIKGKTILITGVNPKGLGGTMADALAPHAPKALVLASRTLAKVQEVIDQLKPRFPDVNYIAVPLDLSSQRSCREAASLVMSDAQIPVIDLVINNAGVMNVPDRRLSPDGIEIQFATNHIGHFLFTNLIMPKVVAAAKSNPKGVTRIVNVSSRGTVYGPVRFSDLNFEKSHDTLPQNERPDYAAMAQMGHPVDPKASYTPMVAYAQSKTANILFSLALTERLYEKYGILSFGVHPGGILTELGRYSDPEAMKAVMERFKFMLKTLDEGVSTPLVAALDDQLGPAKADGSGIYLSDCQITDAPMWAQNPQYAKDLWTASENIVGEKFDP